MLKSTKLWRFCALSIAAMAIGTARSMAAAPLIGINIQNVADWNGDNLFADAMKESRGWNDTTGKALTKLDPNGWPLHDAQIYIFAGNPTNMTGTYALSFDGQATITGATVDNQTFNASTNTTTGTITLTSGNTLSLTFTNTKRTPSSAADTGIADVRLMRPVTPGSSTSYTASTVFSTPLRNLISKFQVIRFMDYLATNASIQSNWTDRLPATYYSFNISRTGYGWEGVGGAWEYAILLCNQTNKDMWICIPEEATDDYVTNVADMIAYGSDGVNSYRKPTANPVFPPLKSNLKVYVEFSNEVWNTAGAFTQSGLNHNAAKVKVAAGGSPLNFDGDTNDWDWAARRTAKRTVEISDIFRGVFGNSAMMTRIRPVLESQEGYVAFWLLQQTHMLEDYYNSAARVSTPHPPSYYIYGGGGSAYYNPDNSSTSLTIDNIWTSQTFNPSTWATTCQAESNYALPIYGHRVAYEGGPGLDNCTCSADAVKQQAWSDSRMTGIVTANQVCWSQNGGDLLTYFNSVGGYQWGFTNDPTVLTTPKMTAIAEIDASTAATGMYGTVLPGTITASNYKSPETWAGAHPGDMSASSNWTWAGYPISTPTAGRFKIALSAGSTGTANQAAVYVDGQLVGTITIPNTGSNSTYQTSPSITTPVIAAGSHGILIKALAGSFGFQSIVVTASYP